MRAADRLNVPVGAWSHIGEVPKWWIVKALIAVRAEGDAAEGRRQDELKGMFG